LCYRNPDVGSPQEQELLEGHGSHPVSQLQHLRWGDIWCLEWGGCHCHDRRLRKHYRVGFWRMAVGRDVGAIAPKKMT